MHVSLKSGKNNMYFIRRQSYIYDSISLNCSQNEKIVDKVVDKIKPHFMFNNVFPKIVSFINVEKYGGVREATRDNTKPRMRFS